MASFHWYFLPALTALARNVKSTSRAVTAAQVSAWAANDQFEFPAGIAEIALADIVKHGYRLEGESIRAAFWLTLLWPLTLLVVVPAVLLDWAGWRVNIEHRPDLSPFGFRRRDAGRGWAVRFLRLELQVWKDTRPA